MSNDASTQSQKLAIQAEKIKNDLQKKETSE
jgi:hypothetical protein